MEWISVEDDLPEEGKWVLIPYNNNIIKAFYLYEYKDEYADGTCDYLCDGWYDRSVESDYDRTMNRIEGVTHWMPLPKLPEDINNE